MTNILAICGSLRTESSNKAVLQAAALLAPGGFSINLYSGLGNLPFFNPDLDISPAPTAIADLRQQVQANAGVIISSPEYAHGIVGSLKNSLDWLVSSGELVGKPIMLINASPRATIAQASLIEILTTMAADIVRPSCITLPIMGSGLDATGITKELELATPLRQALQEFTEVL